MEKFDFVFWAHANGSFITCTLCGAGLDSKSGIAHAFVTTDNGNYNNSEVPEMKPVISGNCDVIRVPLHDIYRIEDIHKHQKLVNKLLAYDGYEILSKGPNNGGSLDLKFRLLDGSEVAPILQPHYDPYSTILKHQSINQSKLTRLPQPPNMYSSLVSMQGPPFPTLSHNQLPLDRWSLLTKPQSNNNLQSNGWSIPKQSQFPLESFPNPYNKGFGQPIAMPINNQSSGLCLEKKHALCFLPDHKFPYRIIVESENPNSVENLDVSLVTIKEGFKYIFEKLPHLQQLEDANMYTGGTRVIVPSMCILSPLSYIADTTGSPAIPTIRRRQPTVSALSRRVTIDVGYVEKQDLMIRAASSGTQTHIIPSTLHYTRGLHAYVSPLSNALDIDLSSYQYCVDYETCNVLSYGIPRHDIYSFEDLTKHRKLVNKCLNYDGHVIHPNSSQSGARLTLKYKMSNASPAGPVYNVFNSVKKSSDANSLNPNLTFGDNVRLGDKNIVVFGNCFVRIGGFKHSKAPGTNVGDAVIASPTMNSIILGHVKMICEVPSLGNGTVFVGVQFENSLNVDPYEIRHIWGDAEQCREHCGDNKTVFISSHLLLKPDVTAQKFLKLLTGHQLNAKPSLMNSRDDRIGINEKPITRQNEAGNPKDFKQNKTSTKKGKCQDGSEAVFVLFGNCVTKREQFVEKIVNDIQAGDVIVVSSVNDETIIGKVIRTGEIVSPFLPGPDNLFAKVTLEKGINFAPFEIQHVPGTGTENKCRRLCKQGRKVLFPIKMLIEPHSPLRRIVRVLRDESITSSDEDLEQKTNQLTLDQSGTEKMQSPKLPIEIRTVDGKTYKIVAKLDWTVEKLKQELEKWHQGKPCTLHYKTKKLLDENILQIYNIGAGDIIQANFTLVKNN